MRDFCEACFIFVLAVVLPSLIGFTLAYGVNEYQCNGVSKALNLNTKTEAIQCFVEPIKGSGEFIGKEEYIIIKKGD